MSNLDFELKKYYKKIEKKIPCNSGVKKTFIKDFKNRVEDFIENNQNISIDEIINYFGNVDDIVNSFDKEFDYYKEKSKKRLIVAIVISTISIILVCLLIFILYDLISNRGGNIIITTE